MIANSDVLQSGGHWGTDQNESTVVGVHCKLLADCLANLHQNLSIPKSDPYLCLPFRELHRFSVAVVPAGCPLCLHLLLRSLIHPKPRTLGIKLCHWRRNKAKSTKCFMESRISAHRLACCPAACSCSISYNML